MSRPDPADAAVPLIEVLERLAVRWYLGGSVASSLLGEARSTLDVDIVAALGVAEAGKLTAALESDYYVSEESVGQAIRDESSFNLIHLESMVKVDVFVAKSRAWDRRALDRRRRDTIEGESGTREVWVASPEDVILAKLEWYRAGGELSERQWQDVVGVIRVQGAHLDRAYLMTSADELGVRDLLDRATGDAGAP